MFSVTSWARKLARGIKSIRYYANPRISSETSTNSTSTRGPFRSKRSQPSASFHSPICIPYASKIPFSGDEDQMWTGCSRSLRHLEICDFPEQSHLLQSAPQRSPTPPIVLESIRLWSTRNVSSWLRNDLSPFDLSHLKTLSFCRARIGLLEIPSFATAFKTIEVLDVSL
ncbi:hypothetical protein FB451DRAFT_1228795, partial [Mycena latifolia]